MSEPRPTIEELNAYIDHELAPADAARVARAVAEDAGLAEHLATLTRLKAATGDEEFDMPEIALPAKRRSRLHPALAAGTALFLLTGIVAVLMGEGRRDSPDWLETAWQAHARWSERANSTDRAGAGSFLKAVSYIGPDAHVPDLSAAKLSIAQLRNVAAGPGGNEALHVGYVGTRGCRISLWISRVPTDVSEILTRHRRQDRTMYAWRSGDLAYAMIASGMDASRFQLVVQAAYLATRARARPDADMRTALRHSRENSPPCLA